MGSIPKHFIRFGETMSEKYDLCFAELWCCYCLLAERSYPMVRIEPGITSVVFEKMLCEVDYRSVFFCFRGVGWGGEVSHLCVYGKIY